MIRKVNAVDPGIKRPFRLQDIQYIYEGLNDTLAASVGTTPRILSGFDIGADGKLSAGVIAFNGSLYMHPNLQGYELSVDDTVYAIAEPSEDDMRALESGAVVPMYYYLLLTNLATEEATLVGEFTAKNLEAWKAFGSGGGGKASVFAIPMFNELLKFVEPAPTEIPVTAEVYAAIREAALERQLILISDGESLATFDFTVINVVSTENGTVSLQGVHRQLSNGKVDAAVTTVMITQSASEPGTFKCTATVSDTLSYARPRSAAPQTPIDISMPKIGVNFPADVYVKGAKVQAGGLLPDSVGTIELQNDSVTTDKIASGAVTGTEIANDAVGTDQIEEGGVKTVNLADGSVTAAKLASGAVTFEKIRNGDLPVYIAFNIGVNSSIQDVYNPHNVLVYASTDNDSWSISIRTRDQMIPNYCSISVIPNNIKYGDNLIISATAGHLGDNNTIAVTFYAYNDKTNRIVAMMRQSVQCSVVLFYNYGVRG